MRALSIEDSEGDLRLLEAAVGELQEPGIELSHVPRLEDALNLLAREPFDVILLDLSLPDSDGLQTVIQVHDAAPAVPMVVLTGRDDEAMAVRALERGAQDYLIKGQFDGSRLRRVIRHAIARQEAQAVRSRNASSPGPRDRVFSFLGVKGGCGASTVACHIAKEVARQTTHKTLLADFDLVSGLVGFLMKAKSSYSVLDAAENVDHMDLDLWKNLVSNGSPRLEILTAPATLSYKRLPKLDRFAHVLRFTRLHYDSTIVDLGRGVTDFSMSLLFEIDKNFLVTTPDVLALSRTKQILEALLAHGYPPERLSLVVNRMPKHPQLSLKEIEDVLTLPAFAVLPDGSEELSSAQIQGALVARKSVLGEQFARFVGKLTSAEQPASKRRRFSIFAEPGSS